MLLFAGMLNYKPVRFRKPLLPPLDNFLEGECRENSKNLHCFRAGDLRVNEHPGENQLSNNLGKNPSISSETTTNFKD